MCVPRTPTWFRPWTTTPEARTLRSHRHYPVPRQRPPTGLRTVGLFSSKRQLNRLINPGSPEVRTPSCTCTLDPGPPVPRPRRPRLRHGAHRPRTGPQSGHPPHPRCHWPAPSHTGRTRSQRCSTLRPWNLRRGCPSHSTSHSGPRRDPGHPQTHHRPPRRTVGPGTIGGGGEDGP